MVTWSPNPSFVTAVDFTVRHPLAARYLHKAARCTDAANDKAAQEKRQRYPTTAGIAIVPFTCEVYGRLGQDACRYLELLSQAAEARDVLRALAPRQRSKNWTIQLSRVLFRAAVRSILEAKGFYTRRPQDDNSELDRQIGVAP